MFGNVGWIVLGVMMGMSSIWLWEIIFLILSWKAYKEWRRQPKTFVSETDHAVPQPEALDEQRAAGEGAGTTKFGLSYNRDRNYHGSLARLARNEQRGKD